MEYFNEKMIQEFEILYNSLESFCFHWY